MMGDAAMAFSRASGELVASRLTSPTLSRAPESGINHIQPSGIINTLMLPVAASSSAMAASRPR